MNQQLKDTSIVHALLQFKAQTFETKEHLDHKFEELIGKFQSNGQSSDFYEKCFIQLVEVFRTGQAAFSHPVYYKEIYAPKIGFRFDGVYDLLSERITICQAKTELLVADMLLSAEQIGENDALKSSFNMLPTEHQGIIISWLKSGDDAGGKLLSRLT